MTGEDFPAADFNMSIVRQINKHPTLELAEYFIGRHLAQLPQVFDGIITTMGMVFFSIDCNFHIVVMLFFVA